MGTVQADDPRLTVRLEEAEPQAVPEAGVQPQPPPARVVLDSRCEIAPTARLLAADGARRFVVTGAGALGSLLLVLRALLGAEYTRGRARLAGLQRGQPAQRQQGDNGHGRS